MRRGRTAAACAGILLAGLLAAAAFQWRPLARQWYLRELTRDPGKIPAHLEAMPGSPCCEAVLEYVGTSEGATAFLDTYLGDSARRLTVGSFTIGFLSGRWLDLSTGFVEPSPAETWITQSSAMPVGGGPIEGIPLSTTMSGDPGGWQSPPRQFFQALSLLAGRTVDLQSAPGWSAAVEEERGEWKIQLTRKP